MSDAIIRKLENIKDKGALKNIHIAQLLDTSPENISRWTSGKISPRRETEKAVLDLDFIVEQLSDLYDDPNDARLWIFSPQVLLDGKRPADLILDNRMDEVIQLINQLRDSVYF